MTEYLYGQLDDDYLDGDPEDALERLWYQAEPPLAVGDVVKVNQWEARPAEKVMPDVDMLLDHYREMVYEEFGEDCVDSIRWGSPALRGAAVHFVAEMNRHIHWKSAGKRVATLRYRLVSEGGEWVALDDANATAEDALAATK
jgi:hypothetical protein